MFENIIAGWKLGSAIRKLVFKDKKLFMFPLVAAVAIIAETIAIFASLLLLGALNSALFIVGLALYYVLVYFTSAYVLVAMFIAFRSFGTKDELSLSGAFAKASGYLVLIFEWAVFEAIVTMIIRAIEQRLGVIGSAIFGLGASIAMSIATAFAIPVIVDKKTGPVSTLKESTSFIIKNFGKTFGGLAYSELYSLVFVLSGSLVIVIGVFGIIALGTPAPGAFAMLMAVVVAGIALIFFGAMLGYILSNVYRFVLYDHMNGGKLPGGITDEMIQASIRKKRQSRLGGLLGGGFGGQG